MLVLHTKTHPVSVIHFSSNALQIKDHTSQERVPQNVLIISQQWTPAQYQGKKYQKEWTKFVHIWRGLRSLGLYPNTWRIKVHWVALEFAQGCDFVLRSELSHPRLQTRTTKSSSRVRSKTIPNHSQLIFTKPVFQTWTWMICKLSSWYVVVDSKRWAKRSWVSCGGGKRLNWGGYHVEGSGTRMTRIVR